MMQARQQALQASKAERRAATAALRQVEAGISYHAQLKNFDKLREVASASSIACKVCPRQFVESISSSSFMRFFEAKTGYLFPARDSPEHILRGFCVLGSELAIILEGLCKGLCLKLCRACTGPDSGEHGCGRVGDEHHRFPPQRPAGGTDRGGGGPGVPQEHATHAARAANGRNLLRESAQGQVETCQRPRLRRQNRGGVTTSTPKPPFAGPHRHFRLICSADSFIFRYLQQ